MQLGDLLERADIGAVWLLIGFILVTMVVDLIMPAAIAKWAILAPIFIPLLIRLDVTPQTVLAAYRVGDSPLNVVTPLMAYFPLIVVFVKRYQKHAGIGTVVSLMLPYVIILSIAWTLFFVAWYLLGIPLGPGSPVHPVAGRRWTTARSRSSCSARSWCCSCGTACRWRSSPIGVALALWATGVLVLDDALAGLRRPDGALHRLAVRGQRGAGRVGRDGVGRAGAGRARGREPDAADRATRWRWSALLTALINVNGAVAALVPVAVVMAVRTGRSPSQLLLPLAFGAHAGLAARADRHAGQRDRLRRGATRRRRRFGFFEFALVGVPLAARDDRDRRAASASGCCRAPRRARSRPTSAGTRAR